MGAFPRADAPLDPPLPEIALLGRSNVGKSSLLNAVVGHRIAKVSATPGKTKALTVFELPRPHASGFYFLDLPGYGYARAPQRDRARFRRLLRGVLARGRLAGAIWLLDLRHDPSADDRGMQDALAAGGTRVLAALTKSDKLPPGRRRDRAETLRRTLGLDTDQVVTTSARTGEGVAELREAIAGLIGGAP